MKIEKLLIKILSLLTLYLNTGFVWAVEDVEPNSSPYWPLIVLFVALIVFRKKLIAEATVENHGGHSAEEKQPQKEETKPIENESSEVTDLTHHVDQCQGTTTKGARCSRSTNLEPIVVNIDNKQYKFLTCKQHHTDGFTPYHFR